MDGDGTGLGEGTGVGIGDGSDDGLGKPVGLGSSVGDALGLGLGDGQRPSVPLRRISCWLPQVAWTIPDGWLYQPRILLGRALTKRAMIVWPTLSPKARIIPPPPLGAVLPTQTPATISGL